MWVLSFVPFPQHPNEKYTNMYKYMKTIYRDRVGMGPMRPMGPKGDINGVYVFKTLTRLI